MVKTKTTHTPGPWRVGDAGHTVFGLKTASLSPKTVATNLSREDARLIAAAPDLLKAAWEACMLFASKESLSAGAVGVWDKLDAAVAKAEGLEGNYNEGVSR